MLSKCGASLSLSAGSEQELLQALAVLAYPESMLCIKELELNPFRMSDAPKRCSAVVLAALPSGLTHLHLQIDSLLRTDLAMVLQLQPQLRVLSLRARVLSSWGPEELQELLTHAPQGPELTVRMYRFVDGPDRGSGAWQEEFERIRGRASVARSNPPPVLRYGGTLAWGWEYAAQLAVRVYRYREWSHDRQYKQELIRGRAKAARSTPPPLLMDAVTRVGVGWEYAVSEQFE
jgi:hypothetical protein